MAGPSLVFSGLPLCRVFRLLLKPFSSFWFFPVRPALAELTRLGYSVLMLDSDISIRSDPYVYLKSPPFSHYQIVIHPEGGNPGLNCGWNYVSGAVEGRPAHWMVKEVMNRIEKLLNFPNPPQARRQSRRGKPLELACEATLVFEHAARPA